MINTATRNERSAPQQLTLLNVPASTKTLQPSSAHARFQLSATTRKRGLAHVAKIRQQLAEQQTERATNLTSQLPAGSAVHTSDYAA